MPSIREIAEVLYCFDNNEIIIAEFKLNGVSDDLSPEKKFYWLKYVRENQNVERLDFLNMNDDKHLKTRSFKQGFLSFDNIQADYTDGERVVFKLNSSSYRLEDMTAFKVYLENAKKNVKV